MRRKKEKNRKKGEKRIREKWGGNEEEALLTRMMTYFCP